MASVRNCTRSRPAPRPCSRSLATRLRATVHRCSSGMVRQVETSVPDTGNVHTRLRSPLLRLLGCKRPALALRLTLVLAVHNRTRFLPGLVQLPAYYLVVLLRSVGEVSHSIDARPGGSTRPVVSVPLRRGDLLSSCGKSETTLQPSAHLAYSVRVLSVHPARV